MIEALGAEIRARKAKKDGRLRVGLLDGRRLEEPGPYWQYRFELEVELPGLQDDTPVLVRVKGDDLPGVVVSVRDDVLTVALKRDRGASIPKALLIVDLTWLVERLRERLQAVRDGAASHGPIADDVLQPAAVPTAAAEPHPAVLRGGREMNEDQERAVRRSLGSRTTFVWGPPGTGKTWTLARIVEAHYRAGRSVLLVSHTNVAVDTALEQVAERLCSEAAFDRGLVLRRGPIVREELRRRFGSQIVPQKVAARRSAPLRQERKALEREGVDLKAESRSLTAARRDVEELAGARAILAAREKELDAATSRLRLLREDVHRHRAEVREARAALDRLNADWIRHRAEVREARAALDRLNADWIRWILHTYDRWRLDSMIVEAEQAAAAASEAARQMTGRVGRLEAEVRSLRDEADRRTAASPDLPAEPEIRARSARIRTRLTEIAAREAAIDRDLAALKEAELLARCRVLATTVHRTYVQREPPRRFETVVVDEASMLMPPLVWWAAGLAIRSVTVAGDFRQLPPIVMTEEESAREWLARDVFEVAGIPNRLGKGQSMPYLVSLGRQYRMRRPICRAINSHFYADRPLRSDPSCSSPSVRRDVAEFPLLSSCALLFVNTARFRPWASWPAPGDYSRYNPFHALLARNLVLRLAGAGYLPSADTPNDAVGVIAPYRAQARHTGRLLQERLGKRARGVASTVHSFQGNERKAVVIDLTDSEGVKLGRFLQATSREQTGARLLNVAVSRAKHHVVLVADFAYLRRRAPAGGLVRRLLDHFETRGKPLTVDGLAPSAGEWLNRDCPSAGCDGRLACRPGGGKAPKPFLGCTEFLNTGCSYTESCDYTERV